MSLVASGHLTRLPTLPWLPLSVGFLRGDPVVAVTPPRLVAADRSDDPKAIPFLLSIGHDAWETEATEATLHAPDRHFELLEELASRSARVLADGQGGLYLLARQYAYRIELRRLGRPTPLEDLRLGKGEVILRGGAESEQRLAEHVRRGGMDMGGGKVASAFRGVAAILALTHGPGGRLYLLLGPGVATDGQCVLDRIEWDARRVERVVLDRPCAGNQSMAAGRDGLYFASYDGQGDRFFLAWDALEVATWTPVKEAHFRP